MQKWKNLKVYISTTVLRKGCDFIAEGCKIKEQGFKLAKMSILIEGGEES
jgi:hypothetical protein